MKYASVQICSIALLLVILVLNNRKQKLGLRSIVAFKKTMVTVICCLILDTISIIMIVDFNAVNSLLTILICKAYLISIVCALGSILTYTLSTLPQNDYRVLTGRFIAYALILTNCYNVVKLEVHTVFDETKVTVFSKGDAVALTYACAIMMIVWIYVMMFILRNEIRTEIRRGVGVWLAIITVCGVIQALNNEMLVFGFSMAIGTAIIFEKLESPSRYLDTETGLFNNAAFKNYIDEQFSFEKRVVCIRVAINTGKKDLTLKEYSDIIDLFSKFLSRQNGVAFRTNSYTFAILTSSFRPAFDIVNNVRNYLEEATKSVLVFSGIKSIIYVMKDPDLFESAGDFINTYHGIKTYYHIQEEDVDVEEISEDIIAKMKHRELVKKEITSALEENRVEAFYQPIYNTKTKQFNSAEALVRIRGRDGNIIPPCEFIPIAEETELVLPWGERVFSLVCEMLGSEDKPECLQYVEVNLSAVQCKRENLYETFRKIMDNNGVRPEQINLEITETVQLSSSRKTERTLNRFKQEGIQFSLDDFGTGNSNLDYVANMPMIGIVKLDYTMTRGFFENDRIKVILPHIIQMIKHMNLEIVCEGVETVEQLHTMTDFEIEYIQGYYFSKPLPQAEFIEFVNNYEFNR